jgi:hypothetical protein
MKKVPVTPEMQAEITKWFEHKEDLMKFEPQFVGLGANPKCTYVNVFKIPFWLYIYKAFSYGKFEPSSYPIFFRELNDMEWVFDELIKYKSFGAAYKSYTTWDVMQSAWNAFWHEGNTSDWMDKIKKDIRYEGNWLTALPLIPEVFKIYSRKEFIDKFKQYWVRKNKKVNEATELAASLWEQVWVRTMGVTGKYQVTYPTLDVAKLTGNYWIDPSYTVWFELKYQFLDEPSSIGWSRMRDLAVNWPETIDIEEWKKDVFDEKRADENTGNRSNSNSKIKWTVGALVALALFNR